MSRAERLCDETIEEEHCKLHKEGEQCPCDEWRKLEVAGRIRKAFWKELSLSSLGLVAGIPFGILIVIQKYEWAVGYAIAITGLFWWGLSLTRSTTEAKTMSSS